MRLETTNNKLRFWLCVVFSLLVFLFLFSEISLPFFVGFILAYICVPLIDYSSRYLNRTLVSFIITIGVVFAFVMICVVLLPRIKECLIFLGNHASLYYSQFITFIEDKFSFINFENYHQEIDGLKSEIKTYLDKKIYILASVVEKITSKGGSVMHFLSFIVTMPIAFFYFLKDWDHLSFCIFDSIPLRQRGVAIEISAIIRKTFQNFLKGQLWVVVFLSLYYSLSLRGIGVTYSAYLGIFSGVFSFVPFIGSLMSCILVLFISVPVLTLAKLYFIMTVYFVGQFIEGYVLYPRLVGRKINLHPLWVLFSFFAGINLGGITGVLIAIPSAAVIRSLMEFAIKKFKSTQAYKQ